MANEERQLDPNAYATKFDLTELRAATKLDIADLKGEMLQIKSELEGKLAELRIEFKDEISEVRITLTGIVSKVEGVESRMNTLQNQMRMLFWFQGAILVALAGMILQSIYS